jgi:hypothetical protein
VAPYREQPSEPPRAKPSSPQAPRPLRWFWYPALMMLGPFGWMTLAMVVRTPRAIARDLVAALPFPVTHDPPSAIDGWTLRVALYGATITLRRAADGVEAEQIARAARTLAEAIKHAGTSQRATVITPDSSRWLGASPAVTCRYTSD